MPEPLVLTFAEIAFLLRAEPDRAAGVRDRLKLAPDAGSDSVAAAGVASLLARGLCQRDGSRVIPGERAVAVTAGLSLARTHTEVAAWATDRASLLHVFSGGPVPLAVVPAAFGQFGVETLDPASSLGATVLRFLDACFPTGEAAIAVRSTTAGVTAGSAAGVTVEIAVARDAGGVWYSSDSADSPDRGRPSTRDGVRDRLAQLLGPQPVGARA
jgi:hypothetical protein